MMGETSLCRWDELHVAAAVGDAAGVQRILQKKTGKSLSHPTDHVSAQLDEIACINKCLPNFSMRYSTLLLDLDIAIASRLSPTGELKSTHKIPCVFFKGLVYMHGFRPKVFPPIGSGGTLLSTMRP